MGLVGRTYDAGKYRYGFNGQEKPTEVDANGNSMTAEFWQYDARLGRRWNVDPVFKEYESPYATFGNNAIWLADPTGADTVTFTKNTWHRNGVSKHESIDKVQGENGSINVTVAIGLDVFYYTENHTEYDESCTATVTSNTKQFFPRDANSFRN